MRRPRRPAPDDRGESLIEVLVTIVVIGLTVPAIMGAVLLSVGASDQDRRRVEAETLLATWAETIARETTDARYPACPVPADYARAPFVPPNVPNGFVPRVVSIDYWVKGAGAGPGTFSTACTADAGVRRLRLEVQVPANVLPAFAVDRTIVVRRPCVAC
jgi:Tfp pilus assembly protein PilV